MPNLCVKKENNKNSKNVTSAMAVNNEDIIKKMGVRKFKLMSESDLFDI